MANDVSIIVRADLGDTLVKLGLAKEAVSELGDTNERSAVQADENAKSTDRLGVSMSGLTSHWKLLVPVAAAVGTGLLAVTGNLGVLAPLVPVVTVALAGLIAPFTTLAAILVAFIPPVTLIAGLLGSLGLGFILAGTRAADGGGKLSAFAKIVKTLGSMFKETTTILANAFLPYLIQLGHAAEQALLFIDKLARMPLAEAMRTMSTQGVEMLTHFLDAVGHVIGKPIRLAFDIAFGADGGQIRNSMLKIWTQIQAFFGKPPPGGGASIQSEISAWFGRQDFTSVGMRWAMELSGAFISALGGALKKAIGTRGGAMILGGAGIGAAAGAALGGPMGAAMGLAVGSSAGIALNHYWPRIVTTAKQVWTTVSTWAIAKFHEITTALEQFLGPTTWHNLGTIAKNVWTIVKTVAVGVFHDIIAVAKGVWQVFDTLVIKTGAWKVALALVKGAIWLVTTVLAPITQIVKDIVTWVVKLANHVTDYVVSAFETVAGIVSTIVSDIETAVGWATKLAGALGGGSGPTLPGGRQVNGRNPILGPTIMAPSLAGVAGVTHNHTHVHLDGNFYGSGDAEFRRFAGKIGDEVSRRQRQRAGR